MSNVQNRIQSLKDYKLTSSFAECRGIFEGHVFFSPINPDEATVKKYQEITQQLVDEDIKNETGNSEVKACVLSLDFKGAGYVRVMQSSRYFHAEIVEAAFNELKYEADRYQKLFDLAFQNKEIPVQVCVIREKLEIVARSAGVPQEDKEAALHPKKYFEFHIRVKRKGEEDDGVAISEEELKELKDISTKFSEMFSIPVPLSFNGTRLHQRYLNVRFEKLGLNSCMERVNAIVEEIHKSKTFEWMKTIAEYVPVDSFRQLDSGWIDF